MKISWRRPTASAGLNTVLALLVAGGAFWGYRTVAGPAAETTSTQGQRTAQVSQGAVSATVTATGTVQSATTANANFVTSGTVTEISVKVGDVVTKGQVLAKVDPAAAQGQLDTAQANLTAARASLTRTVNAGSDSATVAAANAAVTQAQSDVDTAKRSVEGTTLTAPMAGTVVSINGAVGSASGSGSGSSGSGSSGAGSSGGGANGGGGANAGGASSSSGSSSSSSSSSGFIQLADLTSLQVSASFAEADATRLKAGQTAAVTWSALSGARATAKVATIAPTATTSNNVNTYAVVASLDSIPPGARLGQSITVVVTVAEVADAIRVPSTAVRTLGNQRLVQVLVNGQPEVRTVEVGVEGNQFTEITSGVVQGELVLLPAPTTTSSGGTNNQRFPGGGGFNGGGGAIPGGGFNGGGPGGGR